MSDARGERRRLASASFNSRRSAGILIAREREDETPDRPGMADERQADQRVAWPHAADKLG